jgi:hypothetical protein
MISSEGGKTHRIFHSAIGPTQEKKQKQKKSKSDHEIREEDERERGGITQNNLTQPDPKTTKQQKKDIW